MASILIVLSSHDRIGESHHRSGVWLEEFAQPWYAYTDCGHRVTVASPEGGRPPLDHRSLGPETKTDVTIRFLDDPDADLAMSTTERLDSIDPADFDAVHVPGGYPQLTDLVGNPDALRLVEHADAEGKPMAMVGHAPALLRDARRPDGRPLVEGRRLTSFSRGEEENMAMLCLVPFVVETELVARGARYSRTRLDWAPHLVRDRNLVTCQNPNTTTQATAEIMTLLDDRAAV